MPDDGATMIISNAAPPAPPEAPASTNGGGPPVPSSSRRVDSGPGGLVVEPPRPVRPAPGGGGFWGAVAATFLLYLVFLPGLAAGIAILALLTAPAWSAAPATLEPQWLSLLIGLAIALLLGILFALLGHRLATAQYANGGVYGDLCYQSQHLDEQVQILCSTAAMTAYAQASDTAKLLACREACRHRDAIMIMLDSASPSSKGLPWMLGTGYTTLWSRLHRAQEALLHVEQEENVFAGALYDELRLRGGPMKNGDRLLSQLYQAIRILDPASLDYFDEAIKQRPASLLTDPPTRGHLSGQRTGQPAAGVGTDGATAGSPAADGDAVAQAADSGGPPPEPGRSAGRLHRREARTVLREVTYAINDYRDEQWEGLLRLRNRLLLTMTLTGLVTYSLLVLAIINRVPNEAIVAAATFYLVGALIGLFNLLRNEARSDTEVEDYGMGRARLFYTPLISGLAAISGVVLMAVLSNYTGGNAGAAGAAPAPATVPALSNIFRVDTGALLMAAIFGLTPGLLLDRLKQAETYTANIKASSAPSQARARVEG